jgi:hypothetical protein
MSYFMGADLVPVIIMTFYRQQASKLSHIDSNEKRIIALYSSQHSHSQQRV